MTNKRTPDTLVRLLENQLRKILKKEDLPDDMMLKAITLGSKIAEQRHRFSGGKPAEVSDDEEGKENGKPFFAQ